MTISPAPSLVPWLVIIKYNGLLPWLNINALYQHYTGACPTRRQLGHLLLWNASATAIRCKNEHLIGKPSCWSLPKSARGHNNNIICSFAHIMCVRLWSYYID